MAIVIVCPGCRKSLSIREENAGRRVRCPRCQTDFEGPVAQPASNEASPWNFAQGGAAPAPAPEATAPASEAFAFSSPLEGDADGDVQTPDIGSGWETVNRGLLLLQMGILPTIVYVLYDFLAGALANFLERLGMGDHIPWIGMLFAGAAVLGLLIAQAGVVLTCTVPGESGLKTSAVLAASCFLGALAALLVALLVSRMELTPARIGRPHFASLKALPLEGSAPIVLGVLAGIGCFLMGVVFLVLFLRGAAHFFEKPAIAQSFFWYLIALPVFPGSMVAFALLSFLVAHVYSARLGLYFLFIIVGVSIFITPIFFVWLYISVRDLRQAITAALRRVSREQRL